MDDQPDVKKCPAEVYGPDLVTEIMTRLYPTQEACAAGHECDGDVCALEGHWPEENSSTEEGDVTVLPRRPAAVRRCGSGWEFLGSD